MGWRYRSTESWFDRLLCNVGHPKDLWHCHVCHYRRYTVEQIKYGALPPETIFSLPRNTTTKQFREFKKELAKYQKKKEE